MYSKVSLCEIYLEMLHTQYITLNLRNIDKKIECSLRWLFDFDEDLYGQVIETDLIAFLRPEAKFASLEEMTAQIDDDASMARMILSAE